MNEIMWPQKSCNKIQVKHPLKVCVWGGGEKVGSKELRSWKKIKSNAVKYEIQTKKTDHSGRRRGK
jgi:hypothetical protein